MSTMNFLSCGRLHKAVAVGLIAAPLVLAVASAGAYTFDVPSGTWEAGTSWDTGVAPSASYAAYVTNGGTATVTSTTAACAQLFVSSGSVINFSGTGTLTVAQNSAIIGYNTGSGTVDIGPNDSFTVNSSTLQLGAGAGTAIVNQSGGYVSAYALDIGHNTFGNGVNTGTYNLSGGTLVAHGGYMALGNGGLIQTGGTFGGNTMGVAPGSTLALQIGNISGESAVYSISGGSMNLQASIGGVVSPSAGVTIQVGGPGNGTFEVSGAGASLIQTSGDYEQGKHGVLDVNIDPTNGITPIQIGGTATFTNTTLDAGALAGTFTQGQTFNVLTAASGITASGLTIVNTSPGVNFSYSIVNGSAGAQTLQVTAVSGSDVVPEPAPLALLLAGGLALLARRRRIPRRR